MKKISKFSKAVVNIVTLILIFNLAGCDVSTSTKSTNNTQKTETTSKTASVCNHTYAEATCEIAKKCTLCGKISGSALGHSYSSATCTEAKKCTRCGTTNGSALGHDWTKATCQAPKKCTRCSITEGNNAEHSMNAQGVCNSCGKDVFLQFVKEKVSAQLIVPSAGASDNYYCEVKFINHTGYDIALNSHVYANGKACVNLDASDYTLETDYSVKISFYRSIILEDRWDDKYKDMYLDNSSTAETTIKVNGRSVAIKFGTNGIVNVGNTLNDLN